ncbi:hypothetical protein D3C72_1653210 [compost metagenome]
MYAFSIRVLYGTTESVIFRSTQAHSKIRTRQQFQARLSDVLNRMPRSSKVCSAKIETHAPSSTNFPSEEQRKQTGYIRRLNARTVVRDDHLIPFHVQLDYSLVSVPMPYPIDRIIY